MVRPVEMKHPDALAARGVYAQEHPRAMTSYANPYVAGNPVGAKVAFVGRETLLRSVLEVLRDVQHHGIVLFGQRRIGKTSILQHLAAWLPRNGGPRSIYFDLQDKAAWSVGRIVTEVASAVADAVGLPDPEPGPDAEKWFKSVWLPTTLAALAPDESLAILFDEFDVLADPEQRSASSHAFFGYLRELLANAAPRLRLVFVIGRNLDDLSYLAQPLFKGLPRERVSLLDQHEAEALVRLSERNNSLTWTDDAVRMAWALTHGHPYLLQHLCWQVWQRAHDRADPPTPVCADDVERAVPRTLEKSENALEWLWSGLRPAERVIASAFAELGSGPITEEALQRVLRESGVRVLIRELRDAPRLLQEWDLIEPSVHEGYQFRVELLRRWIAEFRPLRRVQQELDHVQPLAENLYRAGEGFYKAGSFEQATNQLRQAIGINPNHLRASELLAEILISRQEWEEARRLLEALYENYPGAAQPRLVQVLLALAEQATDDNAKLGFYEQVLELGKSVAAEAGRRAVYKRRGDRAREAGALEVAMDAYQAAGLDELERSVREEFRASGVATVIAQIARCERTNRISEALELARRAAGTLPDLHDWAADIARLEQLKELETDYQRAHGALASGDSTTAARGFVKVVAIDPEYKEATSLLHEAVTGVSVRSLMANKTRAEEAAKSGAEVLSSAMRRGRLLWWILAGENAIILALIVGGVSILSSIGAHSQAPVVDTTSTSTASSLPRSSSAVAPPTPPLVAVPMTKMLRIAGGTFVMGAGMSANEDTSLHKVAVRSFWIDETEVTVSSYSSCVRSYRCEVPEKGDHCNWNKDDRLNHPINCINWREAVDFCRFMGKRLPTEEEWEYAARGEKGFLYPWGNDIPNNQLCWRRVEGEGTCEVGTHPEGASPFGVQDMAGNVWEWTSSRYCQQAGSNCSELALVERGGSYSNGNPLMVRAAARYGAGGAIRAVNLGVRCAKDDQ